MNIKKFNEMKNEDKETPKEEKNSTGVNSFIGKLFQARDLVHLYHLKTDSYAQHKALNDFYEGIISLADSIVEQYQGYENTRCNIIVSDSKLDSTDVSTYLKNLLKEVEEAKSLFTSGGILNTIDEAIGLISKTLYFLTLK